ncbi:ataxin-10 [Manduca sexta]|uniref:Ataxin-10 n=1 Tax=Manduca sexta TaxID=7130 RepID=A0A921ZEZ5_MANSE|nr:ataxin-10 [Manduca sexta]KAG6456295.1 hypothetical protein O3G_MSEX009644 [Manduca sexta]
MSRDKSVWFAEEILLDAKLINFQLETGEWDAVEEMLRAEAQLSRDAETGRLRPKKASEYTLRLIAEVLHIMRLDVEQASYNRSTLAVAEQCLRLVRSCGAAGTKMQTYISKELSILDSMYVLATEYQHPSVNFLNEELMKCMTVLVQTLGNLVVNNPFNQIMIWNKFDTIILNCLIGQNDKIATAAAMIVYNILLGQPNVLPADDVMLLNSLAYMYNNDNTEYPHLIIEYLIGVENTYIEKLYSKLEPECRMLVLNLAYNILMSNESQDINVSVNFVKFMAHEFKSKSDCILKTVDKYVNTIEPQEVVFLLEIIATASSMDAYMDCLQSDTSLFINCAFLLQAIHTLGKQSSNFFSSINKLYAATGKQLINDENVMAATTPPEIPLTKNDSADNMLSCNETTSECTESESSEQYFECTEMPPYMDRLESTLDSLQQPIKFTESLPEMKNGRSNSVKIDADLSKVAYKRSSSVPKTGDDRISLPTRRISLEHKIDMGDDTEPPLIIDSSSPNGSMNTIAEVIPVALQPRLDLQPNSNSRTDSQESTPNDPPTEIHLPKEEVKSEVKASPSEISPPLADMPQETESQKQSPDTPKEVKKSQNLSTDFDLSEQLQKILGISDKTRGDNANVEKKSEPAKEVKISDDNAANKVPSVKIDSPESQKTRLGAVDMSTPKKAVTCVETVERHVAFGFKAALVRTLANLCWKNPENKKQMRELDVIPILLDCCNIDARNPLIMQWVIFAVRNLCENCPENQEVISKITLQAPVDNEVLQEMGLTLQADAQGNSIRIAPLPRG